MRVAPVPGGQPLPWSMLLHARSRQQVALLRLRYRGPRVALAALAPATLLRYSFHLAIILLVAIVASQARQAPGQTSKARVQSAPLPALRSPSHQQPDLLMAPTILRTSEGAGRRSWSGSPIRRLEAAIQAPGAGAESSNGVQPSSAVSRSKKPFVYKVAPGDTVSEIADRFGITPETVIWANDLWNPEGLQIGEELVILPVSGILHTVASGDNVNDLALQYDVSAESIVEFNDLADPSFLQVGDKLIVPNGRIQVARASSSSRGGRSSPQQASTLASGSFRWPAGGNITQYFGEYGHSGLDIAAQHGSPVYAADGGRIVTALKLGTGYGWHLVIDHENGYQTLYSHLSRFDVDYGERVSKGQRIGLVGSTGLSTGPHLHFEVFQNGVRVNPLKFLP